jgi:hypothetical protein
MFIPVSENIKIRGGLAIWICEGKLWLLHSGSVYQHLFLVYR